MSIKVSVTGLVCIIIVLCQLLSTARGHGSQTTIVKHTNTAEPESNGFWDRKVTWKSRWVKYWRPKAIYIPVWKKVWGPVVQNEWVPIPKPPPGWHKDSSSTSSHDGYRTTVKEY